MSRSEFTFTFTNAQPGAAVEFSVPVYSSATDTTADGPRLALDSASTVVVWADAAHVTATTTDGRGESISATATTANATITSGDGTAGSSSVIAAGVPYDPTASDLAATDVQAALDEVVARIVALETP